MESMQSSLQVTVPSCVHLYEFGVKTNLVGYFEADWEAAGPDWCRNLFDFLQQGRNFYQTLINQLHGR